jgi:cholesterol transport system auxiliary component
MGCSGLSKSYPVRNYYLLSVSNKDQNLSPVSGTVLEIRRFEISASFAGTAFVHIKGYLSYDSDFYNQFFRPPGLLITEEVGKWLSESGLFKYVVDSTSEVEFNYILEGNVNKLYGDFRASNTAEAAFGIQFFLMEWVFANPKIIPQNNLS